MFKRIVSLCLAMLVLLGTAQSFALFEECNYVSLGDSVVNGYGMDGYSSDVRGYKQKVKTAYPYLVAEELNADLTQLAFSGFRAEELHHVLNEEYYGDDFLYACFYDDPLFQRCGGGIDKIRREYKDAIEDADYITLQIGSNNFGTYLQMQLTRYMEGKEPFKFDRDDYANGTMTREIREELKAANDYVAESNDMIGMLDFMIDCLNYTYEGFKMNFDEIVEIIYELNPDVNLIVVGMYNLFDEVHVAYDMVDLGVIVGGFMGWVNDHMRDGSPLSDKYTYVDIMDCEIYGLPANITDENFFEVFTKDSGLAVHPNENGHRYIADRVLDEIFVPFEDVEEDNKYYEAVKYAYNAGLMDGTSEDEFGPNKNVTKGLLADVIYRLENSPEVDGVTTFWDVKQNRHDFADAVDFVVEEGIMSGATGKFFLPYVALSRQKVMFYLWNAAGCPESDYKIDGYYDGFAISKAYKPAMAWAFENGLLDGIVTGKFISPTSILKRGQLATVLMNLSEIQ